jgi:hypothetical protein
MVYFVDRYPVVWFFYPRVNVYKHYEAPPTEPSRSANHATPGIFIVMRMRYTRELGH